MHIENEGVYVIVQFCLPRPPIPIPEHSATKI
jgi:hypothetical protein